MELAEEDVVVSDGEDSKKRSRDKFAAERDEEMMARRDEVYDQTSARDSNNTSHTSKRPRVAHNNNTSHNSDDFSDLLKSYEKHKRLTNNENINNTNHNINKPLPKHRDNRINHGINHRINNRHFHTRNKLRTPSPLTPRITTKDFEQVFGNLSTLPPKEDELAAMIASFLDEKNVGLIQASLTHLGTKETLRFVRLTAEREEMGGVMTANSNRQRSVGGCFFFLLKEGANDAEKKAIFTDARGKEYKKTLRNNNKSTKQPETKNTKQPQQTVNKQAEKANVSSKDTTPQIYNNTTDTAQTNTEQIPENDVDDQIQRIIYESLHT